MSLLKRKHSNLRRTVLGLMIAALLLTVPCVAAAVLAVRFNIDSPFLSLAGQEPSREVQEKRELNERQKQEIKERWDKETAELKQRIANEPNAQVKAELEKALVQRQQEKITTVNTLDGGGYAVTFRRDEEGALQEQRLTVLEIVQSRFPGIEPLAKKTVNTISDLALLRRLIVKMSVHKRRRKLSKHFFR